MDLSLFGKNLLAYRQIYNLTQSELSKKLGITQPAISQYESFKRYPTAIHAYLIAKEFGVTVEFMLTNKEGIKNDQN